MSANYDEQLAEIDFLQSTYSENELVILSLESPVALSMALRGDPLDSDNNHISVTVKFTLPSEYPEVMPLFTITRVHGIPTEDVEDGLVNKMEETAQSMLGMQMIWTIIMDAQEWMEDKNHPMKSMFDDTDFATKLAEDAAALEAADESSSDSEVVYVGLQDKYLVGADERVVARQLEEWAVGFRKEMVAKGIWNDLNLSNGRMTGKAYFSVEANIEDPTRPPGGSSEIDIDEGLFDGEGSDDLDDLELEDE
eukprot:GHVH01003698.1.p1 GENE.GHVH01003698.1~~GHVH01003698.1.p1  ORF type:complete len:252 (-),score=55.38 GHVH01003698.1:78-833(-)